MLKPKHVFFGIGISLLLVTAIPLSQAALIKSATYSFLKNPVSLFQGTAKLAVELCSFKKNADENLMLKESLARTRFDDMQLAELRLENARLVKLLNLREIIPPRIRRTYFARVILQSSMGWNRVLLIDKGTKHGIKPNMLVLSESSLIGKVVETGPAVSKVLLITDPKSRLGVLIQRTRQEGLLFGTTSGGCHMKYISIDTEVRIGDKIETVGFGGFFPKGIPVGTVKRVWKEPGQIYQVAEIKPLMELSRIEEVAAID